MKLEDMKRIIDESPYKDKILTEENKWNLIILTCMFLDPEELNKIKEEYKNEW